MGQTARGRRLSRGESLARQALGLGLLVLVMSAGYAVSRVTIADSTERDVEVVADESTASAPAAISAADINAHIVEVASRYGVEPKLVAAVVAVESQFNVHAVSRRGAEGLMQLMPATAVQFGVKNAFNPEENLRAGVKYLRELLNRYANNEELALAAYNAGPKAVAKYGEKVPPYKETKNYVMRINGISAKPIERRDANRIYKVTEIVDGRQVVRYTDKKPATGTYTVVGR